MKPIGGKLSKEHKMKRLGEVMISNASEKYIREMAELFAAKKSHIASFTKWQMDSMKSISCVPHESNPELKQLLNNYLKKFPTPKEEHRFETAFNLTLFSEKIGYVEGYAVIQVRDFVYIIIHAWNSFETENGTIYFDANCEFGPNPRLIGQANYLKVMQLNQKELLEYDWVSRLSGRTQGPFIYEDFLIKTGRRKPFPPEFSWADFQNNLEKDRVLPSLSKRCVSGILQIFC